MSEIPKILSVARDTEQTFTKNVPNQQSFIRSFSQGENRLVLFRTASLEAGWGRCAVNLYWMLKIKHRQISLIFPDVLPIYWWIFGGRPDPVRFRWRGLREQVPSINWCRPGFGYYQLCYSESEWLAILQPSNPPSNSCCSLCLTTPRLIHLNGSQQEGSNALCQFK